MLLDRLDSPRWRTALLRGGFTVVELLDGANPDFLVYRAPSESHRNHDYIVTLAAGPNGLNGTCDCDAGRHDQPCKHLARVLFLQGIARWWDEIVARRGLDGEPAVFLWTDGQAPERLCDGGDGIEWGAAGGASGRWWLATRIVRAAFPNHVDQVQLVPRLREAYLDDADWQGWRLSARGLDKWLQRELLSQTTATAVAS